MMADLFGLAGHSLLWGVFLAWLLRQYPRSANWLAQSARRVAWLPLLVLVCGWAWYARGVFSDISITGMGLAYCWLIRREVKLPLWLLAGWVQVGALLYMSALGFLASDFYSSGFNPQILLWLAVVWIVINGIVNPVLGWILALALAAYAGRALTSVNLWDYLFDPLTWLVLAGMLVRGGVGYWRACRATKN